MVSPLTPGTIYHRVAVVMSLGMIASSTQPPLASLVVEEILIVSARKTRDPPNVTHQLTKAERS